MDLRASDSAPKRKYFPKSKSGCRTCKVRRVKCDEGRPCCQRCTSTGRKCDGYVDDINALLRSPSRRPNLGVGAMEAEIFEFFVMETAPCLSGFFGDDFWSKTVLQHGETGSVVMHAINALGALHKESYLQRVNSRTKYPCHDFTRLSDFSAHEYIAALASLRASIDKGSVSLATVLTCTALFAHYEFLKGGYISGIMHKTQSEILLKLAMQSQHDKLDDGLVSTLRQIDLQASLLSCAHVPMDSRSEYSVSKEWFSSPAEAKDLVNKWTQRFYRFLRTSIYEQKLSTHTPESDDPKATCCTFIDIFETIELLLSGYKDSPRTKLSLQEHKGLTLLHVRTKVNRILAAGCAADERIYDTFTNDFEEILTSISHVISNSNLQKLIFAASFDEGLLHPLEFVAMKCRDHDIRHRALHLMRCFPTHAGMWHVSAMIKCAERVVQYEESDESLLTERFLGLDRRRVLNDHVLMLNPTDPGRALNIKLIVWPLSASGEAAEFEEELHW